MTRSRLDYCLASQDMLSVITKVTHIYHDFAFTDHKSVLIEIDTNYEAQGCGIFRAAPYLLKNIKYQSTIKDTIYATIIENKDSSITSELYLITFYTRLKCEKIINTLSKARCFFLQKASLALFNLSMIVSHWSLV